MVLCVLCKNYFIILLILVCVPLLKFPWMSHFTVKSNSFSSLWIVVHRLLSERYLIPISRTCFLHMDAVWPRCWLRWTEPGHSWLNRWTQLAHWDKSQFWSFNCISQLKHLGERWEIAWNADRLKLKSVEWSPTNDHYWSSRRDGISLHQPRDDPTVAWITRFIRCDSAVIVVKGF